MRNLLDDIFERTDAEVGAFADIFKNTIGEDKNPDDVARLVSATPEAIVAPRPLIQQISGSLEIHRGWHGDDYVWHFTPYERKRWKVGVDRVLYALAKTMHGVLPPNIEADIWPPRPDWEIEAITFKAYKLRECWSIDENDLNRLTEALFSVLNTLI